MSGSVPKQVLPIICSEEWFRLLTELPKRGNARIYFKGKEIRWLKKEEVDPTWTKMALETILTTTEGFRKDLEAMGKERDAVLGVFRSIYWKLLRKNDEVYTGRVHAISMLLLNCAPSSQSDVDPERL